LQIIYKDLKSRKEHISLLKVFYSTEIQSCIIKLKFDKTIVLCEHEALYLMLDFKTKEMKHYGWRFEQSISDNEASIRWIQNNKVLVFYPDNSVMSLLSNML
jgi:hypothetical protein